MKGSLQTNFPQWFHTAFQAVQDYLLGLSATTVIAYGFLVVLLVWGFSLYKKYRVIQFGQSDQPSREAKHAAQAARADDSVRAGELFEEAHDYKQAIIAYKSVRAFQKVGRVYEQMKQWSDAAQFYTLSGNSEKSAVMYQRNRDYLQAAKAYLVCDKTLLAAEMLEKGGKYKKAAILYEKLGKHLKSAQLYKRSEDYGLAAEKFEVYFLKQKVDSPNHRPKKLKEIKEAAFESAKLYLKIKRFKKAMEVFSAAKFYEQAADAAINAGEIEKAAQFCVSAKLFEKAAKIYDTMGNHKQGHLIMAKKFEGENSSQEAAKEFEQAESWSEAAGMYEKAGDKSGAGKMFQHAGDYHRSANLFVAVGDLESAAESFEKGGYLAESSDLYVELKAYDRAAEMQERIGNYYAAGLLCKKQGDTDQCISYLQKVDLNSKNINAASLLLGGMLIERGMNSVAKDCFLNVVNNAAISPENIELYYELAILLEAEEAFDKTERLYETILKEDFSYKDVKQRLRLLKKTRLEAQKLDVPVAAPSTQPPLAPGTEAPPRYKMIKKIGQGGMGVVYLAQDLILKRAVAYKILPVSIRENAAVLQNFLQEARIAAALNHPNIVTIFDTGKNGDDIYITMEYIDGISLKRYLERYRSSLKERLEIMKLICQGVIYAHNRNVIHRDLKPANIMLLKDRTVKIMDFGLAKMLTEEMQENTSIKGTPLYMSPEQIVGGKVDTLSDIYALGCTFYRMLAGRAPFSKGDIYYQHLHTPPTPPKMVTPDLPPVLDGIVIKCLEKKKEMRFKSVDALLEALSSLELAPALPS